MATFWRVIITAILVSAIAAAVFTVALEAALEWYWARYTEDDADR